MTAASPRTEPGPPWPAAFLALSFEDPNAQMPRALRLGGPTEPESIVELVVACEASLPGVAEAARAARSASPHDQSRAMRELLPGSDRGDWSWREFGGRELACATVRFEPGDCWGGGPMGEPRAALLARAALDCREAISRLPGLFARGPGEAFDPSAVAAFMERAAGRRSSRLAVSPREVLWSRILATKMTRAPLEALLEAAELAGATPDGETLRGRGGSGAGGRL